MIADIAGDAGLSRPDQSGLAFRRIRRDQPYLRGIRMIVRVDNEELPAFGLADGNEETRVGFLIDQGVLFGSRADFVPEYLYRPVVIVEPGVKQEPAVSGKGEIALGAGDGCVDDFSRRRLANFHCAIFRSVAVDCCREVAVIRGMSGAIDGEKTLPFGFRIAVEEDLFGPALRLFAAEKRILPFRHETAEIGPAAIFRGHRGIVFLDPGAQLRRQPLAELCHRREDFAAPGIFRFQIGADIGIERFRLAHDALPVGVAQPGVRIGQGPAEPFGCLLPPFGGGRRRRLVGLRGWQARSLAGGRARPCLHSPR